MEVQKAAPTMPSAPPATSTTAPRCFATLRGASVAAAQAEFTELRDAIQQVASTTEFNGTSLAPILDRCRSAELFDHRDDVAAYDVDGTFEHVNLAGQLAYEAVERSLRARVSGSMQLYASGAFSSPFRFP